LILAERSIGNIKKKSLAFACEAFRVSVVVEIRQAIIAWRTGSDGERRIRGQALWGVLDAIDGRPYPLLKTRSFRARPALSRFDNG